MSGGEIHWQNIENYPFCHTVRTFIYQCSLVNYIVDIRGPHKVFHVDMLRKYYARDEDQVKEILTPTSTDVRHANTASRFITLMKRQMMGSMTGYHIWSSNKLKLGRTSILIVTCKEQIDLRFLIC